MRHIPEEELHAYLDQALSRSQCVEIESHLAACITCRRQRDAIAALRDRTTALLATLVPPRSLTPPFELIEARRAAAAARRHRAFRRAAWAASVLAALGAGWGLSTVAGGGPAARSIARDAGAPTRPAVERGADQAPRQLAGSTPLAGTTTDSAPAAPPAVAGAAPTDAIAATTERRPRRSEPEPSAARPRALPGPELRLTSDGFVPRDPRTTPRSLQVSSSGLPEGFAFDGVWRTLSWENAQAEAGGAPAHVDGLPVVEVQVQKAESGQPLMVVAQQLGSGEVIRTIEGPASDVTSLLRRTGSATSPWPTVEPGSSGAVTARDGSIVTVLGDRILAISAPGLSSDSLAAMARRINAGRR